MPLLSDPLDIRSIVLPNRVWFPPVARDLAGADGSVTEANVRWYETIAAGGAGTVVVEHCFVHPDGRYSPRQLGVHDDELVDGHARVAKAIAEHGAVPILQISHAGPRTTAGRRLGPSAVALPGEGAVPEALEEGALHGIRESFVQAARRAKQAGYKGVEVHAAHGFLLSSFLSPLTNRRTDGYGGDAERRARLLVEVVRGVAELRDERFAVVVRLGAEDRLPGGLEVNDACQVARWLQEAGADVLSISGALCGSRPADLSGVQGYFIAAAEQVKRVVGIPVVGVGGIVDPGFACGVVAQGRVDLVAVGRALVAEPQWARRAVRSALTRP